MKQMKLVLVSVLVVLAMGMVMSCGGKDNSKKSVDDLINHFEKNFTVSDKDTVFYQMLGAVDGCRIDLNGETVSIYKFDSKDSGGKTILANAKKTSTLSFMGMQMPVMVNGSFVIAEYESFPDKNKLKSVFSKF